MKRILFLIFVGCVFLFDHAHAMHRTKTLMSLMNKPFSVRDREKIAQAIMATPITHLTNDQRSNINVLFSQENNDTCRWFKNHTGGLQLTLKKCAKDAEIKIMGSRRWKTSHILSDIDSVIVTESQNQEHVVDVLHDYCSVRYPNVEQFRMKTKAGLHLFVLKNFFDPQLGEMKLEYTIQTPEINRNIIEVITSRMHTKFADPSQRILYAIRMMTAVYNIDTEEQLALKEWTRVLNSK